MNINPLGLLSGLLRWDPANGSTDAPEELDAYQVIEQFRIIRLSAGENALAAPVFPSQILTNDLLHQIIFDFASPATLFRLAQTCQQARFAIQHYIRKTFDINKHLLRFFKDPLAFRSLQARTGTLISGSSALQFFDRTFYPESDLDLYVFLHERDEVGQWLISQGYTFIPNSIQDPDFAIEVLRARTQMNTHPYTRMRGVSTIYTFKKPSAHDSANDLKVQIIVAFRSPMEVILNFHSTVVMNVIAWDHAYSLYPQATFEDRLSLYLQPLRDRDYPAIQKYTRRGWSVTQDVPAYHPLTGIPLPSPHTRLFPLTPRWIADKHSWVLPLNTAGLTPPPSLSPTSVPLSRDPCFVTSWQVFFTVSRSAIRRGVPPAGFRIKYEVLDAQGFYYSYRLYVSLPGAGPWNEGSPPAFYDNELVGYFRTVMGHQGGWDRWFSL
ncbi:hypothetical protein EW026_g4321 [Hermanssonia centrifuga]|uniref:F-box domain-containing protein n=1 Tax=Hermanssonia centrifuga TaxID=98765 RepID=A0A4S4KID0_9APHY|nr:hypothetical protein EW026_g4321 [Hermanssonia centrifuga]